MISAVTASVIINVTTTLIATTAPVESWSSDSSPTVYTKENTNIEVNVIVDNDWISNYEVYLLMRAT